MTREPVTVIATVRDEVDSIDRLLDSLLSGSRPPDEIVIADGGSRDGTVERLRERGMSEARIRFLEVRGTEASAGTRRCARVWDP